MSLKDTHGPASGRRRRSSTQWSKIFSQTAGPGTGHMTNMATMHAQLCLKPSKITSYRTNGLIVMKLCMGQYVREVYKVYIYNDPEFNLTHFKTMSNSAKLGFVLKVGPDIR